MKITNQEVLRRVQLQKERLLVDIRKTKMGYFGHIIRHSTHHTTCDRVNCGILLYPMKITNQEVLRRVQLKKAYLLTDIRKYRVTLS